jgi:hypothetical protein
MRHLRAVLAFCIVSSTAMAQSQAPADIVPFPDDDAAAPKPAEAAATRFYTLQTPLEIIAADPAAAAVVDKDIPGLLSDSRYPMIEGLGLKQVAALSSGELTPEMLARAEADLKLVPRKPGEKCKKLRTESNALMGDRRLPVMEMEC